MAVGGDGTVNEVAQGLAGSQAELAIIPRGTGWDFARTYRIPRRLETAVAVALDGTVRVIDLGRASYRAWDGRETESYFANIASAGMSGAIASSDTFYDPDPGRHKRWSERGVLGVEMEAAVLFTIGALRGVQAGCLLTVSDIVIGEEFTRITDVALRSAVDRLTRVALATVTASH